MQLLIHGWWESDKDKGTFLPHVSAPDILNIMADTFRGQSRENVSASTYVDAGGAIKLTVERTGTAEFPPPSIISMKFTFAFTHEGRTYVAESCTAAFTNDCTFQAAVGMSEKIATNINSEIDEAMGHPRMSHV